ncbi:MAG: DUF1343 domain-containing protein, partial [Pricia sp.]|nr:DUF1343 domain-containing protein [Pricia sp.]
MDFLSSHKSTVFIWFLAFVACGNRHVNEYVTVHHPTAFPHILEPKEVFVGANRTEEYLPLLKDKKVGVVANQTSIIFKASKNESEEPRLFEHLVDSLLSLDVDIKKVFAPEHGFRGEADAGEKVKDGVDGKTGLPLISLYGQNRKPSQEQLKDVDVVLFDIQDVGVRFYTYIATLQ